MADLQPAVISFASLPVQEKVRKIGAAVIEAEKSLESGNRRLGHPADWPWDYLDLVGIKLLGASRSGYDKNAAQCAGSSGNPYASLVRDHTGISSADLETPYPGADALVMTSAAPENHFAGFISGFPLLYPNERLQPDGLAKSASAVIDRSVSLAKTFYEKKIYKSVFVGSFAFVDAVSCDWEKTDRAFSAFAYCKQRFQYEAVDIAICVAGLEFSA
jgi:hypothetical protein